MAFDGIVTKSICKELKNIIGYKVDKIYQPDKNTIMLGLYKKSSNINLLSCISANNYRIHLTKHDYKNPNIAPNFCMLLRKHLIGFKIKDIQIRKKINNLKIEHYFFKLILKIQKENVTIKFYEKHFKRKTEIEVVDL